MARCLRVCTRADGSRGGGRALGRGAALGRGGGRACGGGDASLFVFEFVSAFVLLEALLETGEGILGAVRGLRRVTLGGGMSGSGGVSPRLIASFIASLVERRGGSIL